MSNKLYYVHDPMCSWCWAFRPVLSVVLGGLPEDLTRVRLLGGLAPDTDEPMPLQMRQRLQNTWRQIQDRVPGTRFNFDFWQRCAPRRSTYAACRAVIAAREQDPEKDEAMTLAIQQAYYLRARNPSDRVTLIELAGEIGLDEYRFACDLDKPQTAWVLTKEIELAGRLGAQVFPSLILADGGDYWPVAIDYNKPQAILDIIESLLRMA